MDPRVRPFFSTALLRAKGLLDGLESALSPDIYFKHAAFYAATWLGSATVLESICDYVEKWAISWGKGEGCLGLMMYQASCATVCPLTSAAWRVPHREFHLCICSAV